MKTHKTLVVAGIVLSLILVFAYIGSNKALATVQEATLTINVTYSGNYTSPDALHPANMSSNIYLGAGTSPFGSGSVTIPLTSNGVLIIDENTTDNVPGLHIVRRNGFVEFAAYGNNDADSRENIKATFSFANATITSIQNDPGDNYKYENPQNGLCGVVEGDNRNSNINDDEYSTSGNSGSFCSATNTHSDIFRIFYSIQQPPVICSTNSQCGNDGPVGGLFCQNGDVYQKQRTYTCNNPGTPSSSCSHADTDQIVQDCSTNQTCSNGACTNINITCSTNSQCGTDGFLGSPYCQGNSVYQTYRTYTCQNPGTANSSCSTSDAPQKKNDCISNQTCANGSCINQQINCSSNSDCGTDAFVGSPFCQGNSVYKNRISYTCNNPGTANSYCSNSTTAQLQTNCTASQTCSDGSCIGNCTYHSYQQCSGNSLYWYDSCGNQQGIAQYCANGCSGNSCTINNCTYHSYQRCSGNNLYWFDSCGTQQDLIQYCPNGCYNNSCQTVYVPPANATLTVSKTVRNLTVATNFASSTYASPSDVVLFLITVQASGNQNANNVIVRDMLPSNLVYSNQLIVAGSNGYSGDITSGINLNTINAGQTVTVSYQAQLAPAQNFAYGTTTLTNNVSLTSSNTGYNPTSNATVFVTRQAVLGASYIPTGITNNPWADSFIIPLMVIVSSLYGANRVLARKRGWLAAKNSDAELLERISAIKNSESI